MIDQPGGLAEGSSSCLLLVVLWVDELGSELRTVLSITGISVAVKGDGELLTSVEGGLGICSVGSCHVVCLVLGLEELGRSRGSAGMVELMVDMLVRDKVVGMASRTA